MRRKWRLMLVLPLVLAACVPGAAEYTKTEAPAALRVYGSQGSVTLSFAPGSARLASGQGAHLAQLVRNGEIRQADRVEIAAAGSEGLARARMAAISRQLLGYGIVATPRPLTGLPPDRAVLLVGRYAVVLPPCPDWSKSPSPDFTNEPSSDFGCANAVNLGMTASPADLAGGRTLGAANGEPETRAVDRYLTDKVTQPTLATISLTSTATTGAGTAAPTGAQ
jgi:pilus assembly protein CpaD